MTNARAQKRLKDFLDTGYSLPVVAERLGRLGQAVRQKMVHLGLKEKKQKSSVCFSSSRIELPEELPSVEDALKILAGALQMSRARMFPIFSFISLMEGLYKRESSFFL